MNERWNISRAEGGFIVEAYEPPEPFSEEKMIYAPPSTPRVFTETSALLNFLQNEFTGSN